MYSHCRLSFYSEGQKKQHNKLPNLISLLGLQEKNMRKIILIILVLSCFSISACDRAKQEHVDFLDKANLFWENAVSNNCGKLEEMVRYPVLMDNKSIDNTEELNSRCNALHTSAKYYKEKKGIATANSPLELHESGWLKKEVLEGNPLLKVHVGNDTRFFLLEVSSAYFKEQPATFIFRRDYKDNNGDWKIIMFEPYSLIKILGKEIAQPAN
jgi:hypothetical protein